MSRVDEIVNKIVEIINQNKSLHSDDCFCSDCYMRSVRRRAFHDVLSEIESIGGIKR